MRCAAAKIEPLIATGRQPHHPSWRERFAAPLPAPENPTPVEAMAWRLQTPHGKQLYGLRKQTPEPVFGIIKSGSDSASSCCVDSIAFAASGASSPWPGTSRECMRSAWAERSPSAALEPRRGCPKISSAAATFNRRFVGEIYDSIRGRIDAGKKSSPSPTGC